jgi:hypothetical protein
LNRQSILNNSENINSLISQQLQSFVEMVENDRRRNQKIMLQIESDIWMWSQQMQEVFEELPTESEDNISNVNRTKWIFIWMVTKEEWEYLTQNNTLEFDEFTIWEENNLLWVVFKINFFNIGAIWFIQSKTGGQQV